MENMIEKIVQMDEQAQKLAQQAQQNKVAMEQEIAQIHKEVYEQYLLGARQRIEKSKAAEEAAADEKWKVIEQRQAQQNAQFKKNFAENKDKWVDQIVQNVLS